MPPPICHLDMGVVESLPPELFSELNEVYGGKLAGLSFDSSGSKDTCIGRRDVFDSCSHSPVSNLERMEVEKEGVNVLSNEVAGPISTSMTSDLMPTFLSQIDSLVLQQLPEEVQESISSCLHIGINLWLLQLSVLMLKMASSNQLTNAPITMSNQLMRLTFGLEILSLWIDKYKMSNCRVLNFAELYANPKRGMLSQVLQHLISDIFYLDEHIDDWDEAILHITKLLKRYIRLKVE